MTKIAVLKETATGEARVAATPETVKKFIGLGATVSVEKGAGMSASISDAEYEAVGATLGTAAAVAKDAEILLGVQGPDPKALNGVANGRLDRCGT